MLVQFDLHIWTSLGWGCGEAHVGIAASGRSGGIILAWKEDRFARSITWTGCHVVAAELVNRRDGFSAVVASAYGPSAPALRHELGEDLVMLRGAYPDSPMLIGGDLNVTLQANDRPIGGGGRDQGSRQLREVIASLGLAEMGPSDRRFTWRGPATQSRLDRFLCSNELLAAFPLAEVSTLPRPLSDHTPILWVTQVGNAKPTYFKLDKSWLRDERLKGEIVQWWSSRLAFGSASDQLSTKLKDLRYHLFARQRQILTARTQSRDVALTRIQALDVVEDSRPLTLDEVKEQKAYRGEVAEVDLRIEMDWRQRSRQLWLAAGDANTQFFHQLANGRRWMNCIRRLKIRDQVFSE